MPDPNPSNSENLKRTVGLPGAVLLGLGSILGTGAFVGLGLAVGISGALTPYALLLAGLLAACNAMSSAQLAAAHPVSGGTYAYGYRFLSPLAGFTAGTCFMLAKSASAAAAGLGLAAYLFPQLGQNCIGAGLILATTALVAMGLRRANIVNTSLVVITLTALLWLSIAGLSADPAVDPRLAAIDRQITPSNFLQATALLFVAFTGYGRIATLGEEVRAPRQTIPRAIIVTILVSTALYFAVLLSGFNVLGIDAFGGEVLASQSPLRSIPETLNQRPLLLAITIAAATAMAGVALNLVLGLSRVLLAMGRQGDAPAFLAALSPASEPTRAIWTVGGVIAIIAALGGLKLVWSFSAFTVLVYYAITNICALRLAPKDRLYPRAISWLGLIGCGGLAVFVDWKVIVIGTSLILIAIGLRAIFRR